MRITISGDEPVVQADSYDRVKHLDMIQAIVARLANEAALIRGWALTVSSAFFAFAAQSHSWGVAAVGVLPAVAFWGLNAYYLREERKYRKLFDCVRKEQLNDPFLLNAHGQEVESWRRTVISTTLWPFYSVILIVGFILVIAGALGWGAPERPRRDTYIQPSGDSCPLR